MNGTKLTQAGEQTVKVHGRYTFTARITVDGAYSLNVMQATNRIPEACLITTDREVARAAYAALKRCAEAGGSPDDMAAARLAAITAELHRSMARDSYNPARVDALNTLLDSLDGSEQREADEQVLDDLAATIAAPRNFREWADAHAAGVARQRAGAVAR